MRIRKRQVPLPLSSLSPVPLFIDSTGHLAPYEREPTAAEFGNAYASEVEKSNDSRAPDIHRNASETLSSIVVSASPSENEGSFEQLRSLAERRASVDTIPLLQEALVLQRILSQDSLTQESFVELGECLNRLGPCTLPLELGVVYLVLKKHYWADWEDYSSTHSQSKLFDRGLQSPNQPKLQEIAAARDSLMERVRANRAEFLAVKIKIARLNARKAELNEDLVSTQRQLGEVCTHLRAEKERKKEFVRQMACSQVDSLKIRMMESAKTFILKDLGIFIGKQLQS